MPVVSHARARLALATVVLSVLAAIAPAASASASVTYGVITVHNNCGYQAWFRIVDGSGYQYGTGVLLPGAQISYKLRNGLTYVVYSGQRPAQYIDLVAIGGRTNYATAYECL